MQGVVRNQSGSAMVMAILILAVLTTGGMGLIYRSKIDTQITSNQKQYAQALYTAESGIAEGIGRINSDDLLPTGPPVPGWGTYVVTATGSSQSDVDADRLASDGLDNDQDGLIDETGESYPEILSKISAGSGTVASWVRIEYQLDENKIPVLFGDDDDNAATPPTFNAVVGDPVIRLTAQGERGNSNRKIQIQAVRPQFSFPPTAIYQPDGNLGFNGNAFVVSGHNWDPATSTIVAMGTVPAFVTKDEASKTNAINALTGKGTVEGAGNPSVGVLSGAFDIPAVIDALASRADIVASGAGSGWGGIDDYKIVHVTGNLHVSGQWEGGGILLVEGDLRMTGKSKWYGAILVKGDSDLTGGGNGKHLLGTIMTQGHVQTGGNADILFSSEALDKTSALALYTLSGWREL